MMKNNFHAPVQRIVPGADTAVLFIHGIGGTPRMFDPYLQDVPEGVSVHSLLLPGHGGTAADFGRSSMRMWQDHVHAALAELLEIHERVYIVGHSLGTLLALREAAAGTPIAGMLLLCVPLRIAPKPIAMLKKIPKGLGVSDCGQPLYTYYGIAPEWRVWRYMRWIPRYLELFAISRKAMAWIKQIHTPTRVLMAERDELVSLCGLRDMRDNPCITAQIMPDSHHYEYPPEDAAVIHAAVQRLCP